MHVGFFYLLKPEYTIWIFFFSITYIWRQHMDVFFHLLSLKTTHGCFLSFYLLKPEENTWMIIFPIYLSLKTTTCMLFSIYLSLKTTHGCFLSFYLLKPEDNKWIFFFCYLLMPEKNIWKFFLYIHLSLNPSYGCFFFPFT